MLKNGNHINLIECFVTKCFCEDMIVELEKIEQLTGNMIISPAPANGQSCGRAMAMDEDRIALNQELRKHKKSQE